jgi:hypothetical protein
LIGPDGAQADRRGLDRECGTGFAQRLECRAVAASEVVEVTGVWCDAF